MEWIKLIPAQRPQVAGQLPTAKSPEMRRPRVTALLTPEAVDLAGWLAGWPGLCAKASGGCGAGAPRTGTQPRPPLQIDR